MATVQVSDSLRPKKTNTPLDERTRISSIENVGSILNPFVGLIFYVEDEQKLYKVTSLNEDEDTIVDYSEVGVSTGGSTVSVTPSLTEGKEVAKITVDGTETIIYAPTPTEGSTVTVVNNLESDSTTDALSAAQGKALKGMIEAKDGADPEVIKDAVNDYLKKNPIDIDDIANEVNDKITTLDEKLFGIPEKEISTTQREGKYPLRKDLSEATASSRGGYYVDLPQQYTHVSFEAAGGTTGNDNSIMPYGFFAEDGSLILMSSGYNGTKEYNNIEIPKGATKLVASYATSSPMPEYVTVTAEGSKGVINELESEIDNATETVNKANETVVSIADSYKVTRSLLLDAETLEGLYITATNSKWTQGDINSIRIRLTKGQKVTVRNKSPQSYVAFVSLEDPMSLDTTPIYALGKSKIDILKEDTEYEITEDCYFITRQGNYGIKEITAEYYDMDVLSKMSKDMAIVKSSVSGDSCKAAVEALNDGDTLSLDYFPKGNKKGDVYHFWAYVDTFNVLKLSKGKKVLTIDNSSISVSNGETLEHNLLISRFFSLNVTVQKDGIAHITIDTFDGSFSCDTEWGKNTYGLLSVESSECSLKECELSANNKDFSCPVWYFGASWEGNEKTRVFGQLDKMGYYNFMANAWTGRTAAELVSDLRLALYYGTPKILIAILANVSPENEETYRSSFNELKSLCEEKGIELVVRLHANTKSHNYTDRNEWIRQQGVRIVDYFKAMHDPNKTWSEGMDTDADNYNGYIDTTESHPTSLGAKAIAMRVLTDVPEIMRLYSNPKSLEQES